MYSTCLFCNQDLGRNQEIESFPVGRRLAFDAATGRLWVVCRTCGRWNLTPMEERWEAIEQCERLFRATRLRVSTDNIGLARMRDGSELVRVGKPERPELAAWRYGDVFGRRRRRAVVGAMTSAAGGAALNYAPLVPVIGYALPVVGVVGLFGWALARAARRVGVVAVPGEAHPLVVRGADLKHAVFVADADGTWGIRVTGVQPRDDAEWWRPETRRVDRILRGDAGRWAAAAPP